MLGHHCLMVLRLFNGLLFLSLWFSCLCIFSCCFWFYLDLYSCLCLEFYFSLVIVLIMYIMSLSVITSLVSPLSPSLLCWFSVIPRMLLVYVYYIPVHGLFVSLLNLCILSPSVLSYELCFFYFKLSSLFVLSLYILKPLLWHKFSISRVLFWINFWINLP